jgi:hypothetical protein
MQVFKTTLMDSIKVRISINFLFLSDKLQFDIGEPFRIMVEWMTATRLFSFSFSDILDLIDHCNFRVSLWCTYCILPLYLGYKALEFYEYNLLLIKTKNMKDINQTFPTQNLLISILKKQLRQT